MTLCDEDSRGCGWLLRRDQARSRRSVWKQLEGSPHVLKGELGGLAEEPAVGREDREDLGLRFQPSVARPQPGRPSAFVSSRSSLLSGT